MEQNRERHRILTIKQAGSAFAMQLELFPELRSEFARLAGGSIGVVRAMMETIADEISYDDPMEQTTPERIRSIVGAPEDAEQLHEWREAFWDQYKAAHNLQ